MVSGFLCFRKPSSSQNFWCENRYLPAIVASIVYYYLDFVIVFFDLDLVILALLLKTPLTKDIISAVKLFIVDKHFLFFWKRWILLNFLFYFGLKLNYFLLHFFFSYLIKGGFNRGCSRNKSTFNLLRTSNIINVVSLMRHLLNWAARIK